MANNLMITSQMLRDKKACEGAIIEFEEVFGGKAVINAPNIKKATELHRYIIWAGDNLLTNVENITEFHRFINDRDIEHSDICRSEGNDCCTRRKNRCEEIGEEMKLKKITKFVELYRKENKAPRKPRKKDVSNQE